MNTCFRNAWLPTPDRLIEAWLLKTGVVNEIVEDDRVFFDPFSVDLIVFVGGEDIDARLYGQKQHPTMNRPNVERDRMEVDVYQGLGTRDIPKLGICRGAQFLNVMNGGSMWQDVDGHVSHHPVTDKYTGDQHEVTSTHHQMMIPFMFNSVVVATAQESTRRVNGLGVSVAQDYEDTEVVWYPRTRSLCFQPHPEYGHEPTSNYALQLIERYLCAE